MKPVLLLLSILLQTILLAQTPPASKTNSFVPAAANRIDQLIQQYVDNQWIAGATAIVIKDGQIVYHKAFGSSNISTKEKMRTDHIFRIASQTKAITSTAVMILLEEGKLLLDEPVEKYIPAFSKVAVLDKFNSADSSFTTKPAKGKITIRHLLTHTSGIGYAQIGSETYNAMAAKAGVFGQIGVPFHSLEEQVNKIASIPLEHQPGEKWTYGLNTDVLGRLVEVVSKQSLADFFRTRIFEPLGMKDTWFYLPSDKQNRLVALHGEDSLKKVTTMKEELDVNGTSLVVNYPNVKGKLYSGGGGLVSTAYDYALFMQMMLNKGSLNGKRILSPNSVKLMTSNQIGHLKSGYNSFGLGFGITSAKESLKLGVSEGSFDWGGAFSSSYWIDPEQKIVAQLFINQWPNSHGEIHEKFKVLVYSALD
ncbi:serine hydrolase domain-containing protein [Flavihumibacter cheonanensis]|uniref:serine hydrolase domain-containing protein n=1 Tax=Flavihumibacter cheonanensis TaxID=1442385 RepID=UPI001EF954D9|nr:serine hydrolase domain-containing protein [Flavihumibacter cheonanensis]MCG7753393.1 beta-lactamase family protein [Flavihumibacter cheonanensis]